jgi:DNA-binding transcriptional ArsR family regulator
MEETRINQTAELLKVIAHPARLKILLLLASQGPRNVSGIQDQLHLEQSLLSHHLIKLKDKGVLTCQRKGKEMHYGVNDSFEKKLPHLLSGRIADSQGIA